MDYLTYTGLIGTVLFAALSLIINARNGRLRKDFKGLTFNYERQLGIRESLSDMLKEYQQTQAIDRDSLAHKAKILEEKNMEIVAWKEEVACLERGYKGSRDEIDLLRRALMREAPRTRTFLNSPTKYYDYLRSIAAIKPRKRPYLSDKQAVEIGKKAQEKIRANGKGLAGMLGERSDNNSM